YGVEVGAAQAGMGYTGEWFDGSVGMVYLRARWMQPEVGRFTSKDAWPGIRRQPQTRNGWSYANGNPINLVDPTGLYSIFDIKKFFDAKLYNPDVLNYFEEGQPLAGRWGWLEVLRQAENGDRLVALKPLGGCPPSPDAPWVYGPGTWENVGEFWKTDIGDLFLVQDGRGLSHHHAALEGSRYRVEEFVDHCIHNSYTGAPIYCDPLIETWAPKMKYGPWEIDPTQKYEGIRCDPAGADWVEVAVNGIFLLLPYATGEDAEDILDLVKLVILVANASTKEDASAAIDTFIEEANLVVMKLTAKYGAKSIPLVGQIVSVIDSFSDVKSMMDNSGCHWLP
ncbi:MAG: RHS repeat-associated core domain-containing protein, partial [Chloroflexota bacterium]|nr:RHS repeat-associated core domain-containing protein [Chloroflexota bacterium]